MSISPIPLLSSELSFFPCPATTLQPLHVPRALRSWWHPLLLSVSCSASRVPLAQIPAAGCLSSFCYGTTKPSWKLTLEDSRACSGACIVLVLERFGS